MAESLSPSANQTIALIESNPLHPASWEKLAEQARRENDPMSVKSLEVIVEGLRKLEQVHEQAIAEKRPAPKLSALSQSRFMRLAKAYNSPTLLKEVGLIYLRDLALPKEALHHFERALFLGGPERELKPLIEAAAVSRQRQIARDKNQEPAFSGITPVQHAQPIAPEVIRHTGKMLLPPARPNPTAPSGAKAEPESEAPESLPETTAECLSLADAAIREGAFSRAEALLRKANEKPAAASEMWQAWTNLGQACFEKGEVEKVEAAFLEALKYNPDEMASHFNVALGYHLNRKFEQAITAYSRANELRPGHRKLWCNLGALYFQLDGYEQAEEALRFAVGIDPTYARAWDNLAAALGAQDKLDEALEACRHAVELRPDYPEAHFKMGVICFGHNRMEEAAAEFRRALAVPELTVYCDVFLAMIFSRLEQPAAAEDMVRKVVQLDPKCELLWMAWNELGLAWYSGKNYSRAAEAYGEATMLRPDEPGAWFNLGVSYHNAGDLPIARNSYQQAVDLRDSLAGAWHNLGIVCAEMGDLSAAALAFRRETRLAPDNVRAWYDLGVTCEKMGRTEEAQIAFVQADGSAD